MMDHHVTLVLGGARSGKTRHGMTLAEQYRATGLQTIYVATAEPHDDEMRDRINLHKQERDALWTTIDAPLNLAATISAHSSTKTCLLVDCLTLWATNLLLGNNDIKAETSKLLMQLNTASGPVILVSNEVGLGIVPDNALARRFRDIAGRLNHDVAAAADRVIFVAAGLPLVLKGQSD